MSTGRDNVSRVMTQDGSFRIIATTIEATAQAIAAAQSATDQQARELAELVMCAVLVRETSAPNKRVQVTLMTPTEGSLVAESRPDGACRGFINPGNDDASGEVDKVLFQVAYYRRDGLHQSTVAIDASLDIAGALMQYLQTSEQIEASVELSSGGERGSVRGAGYAVQLMPDAVTNEMATMTENLEGGAQLLATSSAEDIVTRLAGNLPVTPLAASTLRFECTCSRERVVATLAGLSRADLSELMTKGEPVEVNCDGCNQTYRIELAELSAVMPPVES